MIVGEIETVGPVARGTGDIGSGGLGEAGVEIRAGAVERPADVGNTVDEDAAVAAAAVDVVETDDGVIVELEQGSLCFRMSSTVSRALA